MEQMTKKNLNDYIISSNLSIKDAIKRMDKSGLEICICLDNKSKKVVGLFTEGDFRNAVHQGINLNNKVIKILNKRFHYVSSITRRVK